MNLKLINFIELPYELQLETRNWRNSLQVSKFFKIKNITQEMHKNWLDSLVQKIPLSIAFVIYADLIPIGVTYFHSINYIEKYADWGMYIYNEQYRSLGIGHWVLNECIIYASQELQLKVLFLDVHEANKPAIKLYESCKFRIYKKSEDKFLRYEKKDMIMS